MNNQPANIIRKVYVAYIFLLIAFAVFAYLYQLNLNKKEDIKNSKPEDILIIEEEIDSAIESSISQEQQPPGSCLSVAIGCFDSEKDARAFFNSQREEIVNDLKFSYKIDYARNKEGYCIIISPCETMEKAEILGERLKKHFKVSSYEVLNR